MPDATRWPRVKHVFQSALDRPAAERAAFLAAECGDDGDLRREVASLLAAEREAGDFLSLPATCVPGPLAAGLRR